MLFFVRLYCYMFIYYIHYISMLLKNNKLFKSQRYSIIATYFMTEGSVVENYFRRAFRKFSSNISRDS